MSAHKIRYKIIVEPSPIMVTRDGEEYRHHRFFPYTFIHKEDAERRAKREIGRTGWKIIEVDHVWPP